MWTTPAIMNCHLVYLQQSAGSYYMLVISGANLVNPWRMITGNLGWNKFARGVADVHVCCCWRVCILLLKCVYVAADVCVCCCWCACMLLLTCMYVAADVLVCCCWCVRMLLLTCVYVAHNSSETQIRAYVVINSNVLSGLMSGSYCRSWVQVSAWR
jgi:hypothetical protein